MKMNILLIEDNKDLRELFKEKFEAYGLTVFQAENGKIGLEIFIKEAIDLVLTDIQMPVMSGMEFLKEIRGINGPLPPIFVMTGGSSYTIEQILEAGAAGYFDKTNISIEEIIEYSKKSA
jgi:two-component system chemotaxis response regulator CheY